MNALQITDAALIQQAETMAKLRGITAEQVVKDTVSKAFQAQAYFSERASRADPEKALAILARMGVGNPPDDGDELPSDWVPLK